MNEIDRARLFKIRRALEILEDHAADARTAAVTCGRDRDLGAFREVFEALEIAAIAGLKELRRIDPVATSAGRMSKTRDFVRRLPPEFQRIFPEFSIMPTYRTKKRVQEEKERTRV